MQTDQFFREERKARLYTLGALLITIILALTSLSVGQYGLSVWEVVRGVLGLGDPAETENVRNIILNIRLPRTIASIAIGGILAISGLTYQFVFRNNLVSQDILGVSTSACVGAALGIVLGLSTMQIQMLSFIMGILNICIIFLLSSGIKLDKTLSLILSGILIGGAMSSVLALIKYLADPEVHLQAIVFWTMGDISSITLEQIGFIAIPAIVCTVIIFIKRWSLTYFCFEDSEAVSLGVNIKRDRILFLTCATVLVASAVSISGSIGWVGLVIPQLIRLITGNNSKHTVPQVFLVGSSFLLLVDIINRLISTAELPVSIISGLLGLPVFIVCWFANAKRSQEQSR